MEQAEVRKSLTVAAVPVQVRAARMFVAGAARAHPRVYEAVLLAGEVVSNSVRHSGSAVPGGVVTVSVTVTRTCLRVEVTDRAGDGSPALGAAVSPGDAESGRGLRLVDALAARWGYERGGGLATTWFVLRHG